MQVVSGPIGRQNVHFEAPPADRLDAETSRLLDWLNGSSNEPPLLKAGLGEMSTLLLGGQRARPVRLLEAGFTFRFNDLQSALDNLSSGL